MSSIEPNGCGGEMDSGEEVLGGFVIAGRDGAELLELGEEVLDQVPGLVEIAIIGARRPSVLARRDDGRLAGRSQGLDHPLLGIEGLVGNERLGLKLREQGIGSGQIMGLAARQGKADGVAQSIHQRMDLGRQPTFAASNGLVVTPFFRAPAAC